jgi:hypothetical protein
MSQGHLTEIDNAQIPNFFGAGAGPLRYSNPFYGVPQQFLPLNIDHQIWWSAHFLVRFGFYRTALERIANYFITSLKIECDDIDTKQKYEDAFEKLKWKERLAESGLNLLSSGNLMVSVAQGFDRFLQCQTEGCKRITNIQKIDNYEFTAKGHYILQCPQCQVKGDHLCIDKPSKDLERLNLIFWNPREIQIRFDRTTNTSEYLWDIPQEYSSKVTQVNNKFFSKVTPKPIFDAIYNKRLFAFNNKNFVHIKTPTPVLMPQTGKGIPLCIYLWDSFFMLKVLERYNETIMFEDIVPFRVFSMAQPGGDNRQTSPVIHQNASQWKAHINNMIEKHRQDPGAYHMFPFPFQYDHLGGDGKQIAPTELIQNTIGNILNALNIPQELYTMNLQVQAMSPALRLFENSWSFMIDVYNNLLQEIADIISKIQGYAKAKVSILPVTLSDDIERKSIIGQLVSANSIARSTLLDIYHLDFKDQLKKKMEEDEITKELQEEQQIKDQLKQMAESGQSNQQGGSSPGDVLQQAQTIAQQLFPLDGAQRRTELQKIKATNQTLWSSVKSALDDMTSQAKSQGVQGSKQQAQGGQQQ